MYTYLVCMWNLSPYQYMVKNLQEPFVLRVYVVLHTIVTMNTF